MNYQNLEVSNEHLDSNECRICKSKKLFSMILFYSKNANCNIWNEVRVKLTKKELQTKFEKIDKNGRRYTTIPLHAPGESSGITGQK